ncbi:hypothetical protein MPER_10097 [Moniliophthora perniciosa FA553]|nr:hypothetical protein MPER_10097 [Moniliophthora perniciosa FA553]
MDILTDRNLFNLRKRFVARDHRLVSAAALFLGALGVACGLRFLVMLSWLFVPAKDVEKSVVDQK